MLYLFSLSWSKFPDNSLAFLDFEIKIQMISKINCENGK